MAGDRFEVFSAGVSPAGVNPYAVQVMAEMSIDISHHTSDSITQYLHDTFDYIITVCDYAQQVCPVFPGKYKKIHWNIEDPVCAGETEEERLNIFRKTRDTIKSCINNFISE